MDKLPRDPKLLESNPAINLVSLYESMLDSEQWVIGLETTKMVQESKALRALEDVKPE
jgi:hypothetical protein